MRARRSFALASFLAIAVAIPTTAHAADKTGSEGQAKTVEVLSPSADAYVKYHGRLFVTAGKSTVEYRWGGTSCGSRTLSADMIQVLVESIRQDGEVNIAPRYQNGQGSAKCLVGFSLRNNNKRGRVSKPPT
ncbi:hypothetical protein ENSA5_40970 [Enhygromyxa salina]|uniref:Uncharacterized protein n=1 Tax=Enhygromyxa salina TaxID=215803 RepID=A0A2S9XNN6_9BACT|nr:hypothetical protein [Enhygromyxa salina]PRP94478.1 hypothetical protein ENSA5_40970 [Enhygromyxa salina]